MPSPSAYAETTDHLTGATDAILKRPATDPLVMHSQSATEYWQRRGSLVHTNTRGEDLPQPETVRVYHWCSSQHAANPLLAKPARGPFLNAENVVCHHHAVPRPARRDGGLGDRWHPAAAFRHAAPRRWHRRHHG